ncbi:hypothetical protein AHF37_09449 [Paragonimus kellicotti]|nr:hypothetical protein AHF37_09449 [Paragonimus kellicotti]
MERQEDVFAVEQLIHNFTYCRTLTMSTVFKVWCIMTWLACIHSYQTSRGYYPQPSASKFNPNQHYNNGFNSNRHYIPRKVNRNDRGRFIQYPDSRRTKIVQPIKQSGHAPNNRYRMRPNRFPVKPIDNFENQNNFNRRRIWPAPTVYQRQPPQTLVRPRPTKLTSEEASKLSTYLKLFTTLTPYLSVIDLNRLIEILKPILPNSQLDQLFRYIVHAFASTNQTTLQNVLQSYSQDSSNFITDSAEELALALERTNVLKLMQVISPILARTDLGDLLETLVFTEDSVIGEAIDLFSPLLEKFDWAEIFEVISPTMRRTNLVELSKVLQSAASEMTMEDMVYAVFPDYVNSPTASMFNILPTWAMNPVFEFARSAIGSLSLDTLLEKVQEAIPVDSWEQMGELFRTVSTMFANTDLAELTKLLLPVWSRVNFTRLKETVPARGNISEIIQTMKTVAPIVGRIDLTETLKNLPNTIGDEDIQAFLQLVDVISQASSKLFRRIPLRNKQIVSPHLSGFGPFSSTPRACKPDEELQQKITRQVG